MRSNLIGRTIFLTSEKYRMTNQKPDTIFFTSEKIRIGFSRLSGRSCEVDVCNVPCFTRIMASRFADINSLKQFIDDQENENTKKKTQQNVALLKEFLTLRNKSRLIEETPPKELNASLNFIITVQKKDSYEYYEPSTLRSLMASFE